MLEHYPECASFYNGSNLQQYNLVNGNFNGQPAEVGVTLGTSFGPAGWLALAIHAIGVEIYVC
jgi:hypothetical protein